MTTSRDIRTGKPAVPTVGGRGNEPAAHRSSPEPSSLASTRTIVLTGARGGQGTTTVAAALALFTAGHHPTTLVTDDLAGTASLLGIPAPAGADGGVEVTPSLTLTGLGNRTPTTITVVDPGHVGRRSPLEVDLDQELAERYVVLRGPCYVALASILNEASPPPDGVIVLGEAGRSLTGQDVTDVLGVPVVASVTVAPAVFRTIDAGLLVSRAHRIRELSPLRTLATTRPHRRPPHPARHRPSTALSTHTDLQRPQSGRCGNPRRVANA